MPAAGPGPAVPASEPPHGLLSTDSSLPQDVFLLYCWGRTLSSTFPKMQLVFVPWRQQALPPSPSSARLLFYRRQGCSREQALAWPPGPVILDSDTSSQMFAPVLSAGAPGSSVTEIRRLGLRHGSLSVSTHHPEQTRRCFLFFILGKSGAVDWRREAGLFVRLPHEFAVLF